MSDIVSYVMLLGVLGTGGGIVAIVSALPWDC